MTAREINILLKKGWNSDDIMLVSTLRRTGTTKNTLCGFAEHAIATYTFMDTVMRPLCDALNNFMTRLYNWFKARGYVAGVDRADPGPSQRLITIRTDQGVVTNNPTWLVRDVDEELKRKKKGRK